MLTYCLYRSRSKIDITSAESANIYLSARYNNRLLDVTGYLHCEAGFFLQYLEGSAPAIAALVSVIEADHRHSDIEILNLATRQERLFEGWDMAFSRDETDRLMRKGVYIKTASLEQVMAFFDQQSDKLLKRAA